MKNINVSILDSKIEDNFFVSTKSNVIKNDSKDFSNCLKQIQNDIKDNYKLKNKYNSKLQYKKAISSKTVTKGKNEKISTGDLEEDVENISPLSDKLKSVNSQIQNLILQLLELYTNYDENNENEVKESIEQLFKEITETLVKKNEDYGSASFDLGLIGNMVHVWDKTKRYRSLVEKQMQGEKPNFETVEDTLKDLIGYAVIGLHILKEQENGN